MAKRLHIIAFDVPTPPNYGGIVDVFYKLKSLHAAGVEIIYHCYFYKGHNSPTKELKQYCTKLYYYERRKSLLDLVFSSLPYVVASRKDPSLLMNVLADPAPVLIDGIQCAYWLNHENFGERKLLFRANNIEHNYYEGLAQWERNPLKKIYLKREAKRLKKFELELKKVDHILSVAKMDIPHFSQYAETHHVPPFFNDSKDSNFRPTAKDEEHYVLFQGNLSVKENEHAAVYIAEHIAPKSNHNFVVAGLNPSTYLIKMIQKVPNMRLIESPSHEKMNKLIQNAQINLLMTFQQTGIKLKLLHALQSGRHIIINSKMDDVGIFGEMVDVLDDPQAIANRIDQLIVEDFTKAMKEARNKKFDAIYSNTLNARKILDLI